MRMRKRTVTVLLLLLLGTSALALGQSTTPQSGPSDLLDLYKNATVNWMNVAYKYANRLFGLLAVIDFAWAMVVLFMEGHELQGWVAGFLKKFMSIGIFYAILINHQVWLPAIISSFTQIGQEAGGVSGYLNPSDILLTGLKICGNLLKASAPNALASAFFPPLGIASLFIIFAVIVIFLAYVVITLTFIMTTVESYIVLSIGIIFLGFGAARWTVPYTERYISLVVSTGVKLMMLYTIIGLGQTLSNTWVNQASQFPITLSGIQALFGLVASVIVFMALAWQVPKLASSLLSGSLQMGSSDLIAPATTAVVAGGTMAALGAAAVAAIPTGGTSLAAGGAVAGGTVTAGAAAGAGGSFAAAGAGTGALTAGGASTASGAAGGGASALSGVEGAANAVAAPQVGSGSSSAVSSSGGAVAPPEIAGNSGSCESVSTGSAVGSGSGSQSGVAAPQGVVEGRSGEMSASDAGNSGTVGETEEKVSSAVTAPDGAGAVGGNAAAASSPASGSAASGAAAEPISVSSSSGDAAAPPQQTGAPRARNRSEVLSMVAHGELSPAEGEAQLASLEGKPGSSVGQKISSMHNSAANVRQHMPEDGASVAAPSLNIHHGE